MGRLTETVGIPRKNSQFVEGCKLKCARVNTLPQFYSQQRFCVLLGTFYNPQPFMSSVTKNVTHKKSALLRYSVAETLRQRKPKLTLVFSYSFIEEVYKMFNSSTA